MEAEAFCLEGGKVHMEWKFIPCRTYRKLRGRGGGEFSEWKEGNLTGPRQFDSDFILHIHCFGRANKASGLDFEGIPLF